MPTHPQDRLYLFIIIISICFLAVHPVTASDEKPANEMTLAEAIETTIKADLGLRSSKEDVKAAVAVQNAQKTKFYPTFNASYQFEYNDEGQSISPLLGFANRQQTIAATITQPLFTGFALENQYALAGLGLDLAETEAKRVRQDVILKVKQDYFTLLRTQKLLDVARQTVTQISAQKTVAENYYQVGMTPLNDLLQVQVELANANQAMAVAKNDLEIARSNFNTTLRRPVDERIQLQDILEYTPFAHHLAYCRESAENNRLEIKIVNLEVESARKEIELAKNTYYPTVNLQYRYFRIGEDWDVNGGSGIADPSGWSITTVASWNFWEWGRSGYNVTEKRRRLAQAKYQQEQILDQIRLEIKSAWLRTKEAEENIKTVEQAIDQAKENFRINQERYKEQVATNTDVLIAQTLLTRTMTNYYNALYDFQLSKAALYRAMGQEIIE